MVDPVLHTGASHPDLLWILVPSLLTFVVGLGVAAYADRIRAWLGFETTTTTD
ncbi:hypothetical protein [Natrinema halophilum]|uniref:Uncharacterized protein n=1 Tax=Natrinema halophilum TaxID=1699371 RepID=A0A7D5GSW5_9EURY|nr:hypothetical protein [Natrinema halophilum]QLG49609.1 hypothetical protein HYG82_12435 [Natrinema halophilum]